MAFQKLQQRPNEPMQAGGTFLKAFSVAIRVAPRRALGALYWFLLGRRVRARNRLRMAIEQSDSAYPLWIETVEQGGVSPEAAAEALAGWRTRPTFSILLHQDDTVDQSFLDRTVSNLIAQIYPYWELIVVPAPHCSALRADAPKVAIASKSSGNGSDALRIAADLATGDYLIPLAPAVCLPAMSLFRYAEVLQAGSAELLVGDQDILAPGGERVRPWFKPEWNDELALAQDYFSQAFAVATSVAREILGQGREYRAAAAYALALGAARRSGALVRHVAHVQAHVRLSAKSSTADRIAVLEDELRHLGAAVSPGVHDTIRVDWPLPARLPLVSIIVPTRDQVALLRACLSSVERLTGYRPFEIVVVDNGSVRGDTLAYLSDLARRPGFRVLRDDGPFNFSRLNNMAAAQAHGEYLCFLNNDTEVIDGEWLRAMMRQATRENVGAVGARLLYDDGSIQHAGVGIGLGDMGAAGHPHRFQPAEAEGYFARTQAAHYVSAVTGACLVVERQKFLSVGGFDEEGFAVAFNDVDLCLKLQRAGWRNVYTPHATLVHHESKSRGKDFSPQHIERFNRELSLLQARWATHTYLDPLFNIHLDRTSETYLIRL